MTMLRPLDDYLHPLGPEANFNESMYFQFHDPDRNVGGFLRLGNRPNEGYGERTVCLYLPSGYVAFGFARPAVQRNDSFDAAGLSFTVVDPFKRLTVAFDGEVNVLADPAALANPKQALSASPIVGCQAHLDFSAAAPPYAQTFDGDGEAFLPNHYEQLMRVGGSVTVGDDAFEISGYGMRDHSWGPRSWQAPWFYRWVHGSSADFGFMGAYFGSPDGADDRWGGFVWDGAALHTCDEVLVSTERDVDHHPRAVHVTLASGQRRWAIAGRVGTVVPLRHRKNGLDGTRIAEAATVWTGPAGRTLNGMAEYLDQIRDRLPVGLRV
jgi:hypothetical protein